MSTAVYILRHIYLYFFAPISYKNVQTHCFAQFYAIVSIAMYAAEVSGLLQYASILFEILIAWIARYMQATGVSIPLQDADHFVNEVLCRDIWARACCKGLGSIAYDA